MRFGRRFAAHSSYFILSASTVAVIVASVSILIVPVNALWLRPLPISSAETLVVAADVQAGEADSSRFSEKGLERLRSSGLFTAVAGAVVDREEFAGLKLNISIQGRARVETIGVTTNYFDVLGVSVTGRSFGEWDEAPGATPAAIISERLWRTEFNARTDLLGTFVEARPEPLLIVGIVPGTFHGALRGENADVWIPHGQIARLNKLSNDLSMPLIALCRLRPGLSPAVAEATLAAEIGHPRSLLPIANLFGGGDSPMVRIREGRMLTIIGVTAALVLVAGCGALVALVLVHYENRRSELAIRLSLGASRYRLASLLLKELAATWLSGLWLGLLALTAILRWLPHFRIPGGVDFARLDLGIDGRVVFGAFATAVIAAALAASIPLWRVVSEGKWHQRGSSTFTPRGTLRVGRTAVLLHTAVTVTVLIVAAMFIRCVRYGLGEAPGFDSGHLIFVSIQTRPRVEQDYPDRDGRGARDFASASAFIAELREMPLVRSVVIGGSPISSDKERQFGWPRQIAVDGGDRFTTHFVSASVGPGFLQTVGIPLLLGREGGGHEAVVSPELAAELWPGESPIGHDLWFTAFKGQVVGVAPLVLGSVRRGAVPAVLTFDGLDLLPLAIRNANRLALSIRTERPDIFATDVRRRAESWFPSAPVISVTTGDELTALDIGRQRLAAWFFSTYGTVAFLLAISGTYGLVSYVTHSRRKDFSIMMALGARSSVLRWYVLRSAVQPAAMGAIAGVACAIIVSTVADEFLLGQGGGDPVLIGTVSLVVIATSVLAGVVASLPLQRMSSVELKQISSE